MKRNVGYSLLGKSNKKPLGQTLVEDETDGTELREISQGNLREFIE